MLLLSVWWIPSLLLECLSPVSFFFFFFSFCLFFFFFLFFFITFSKFRFGGINWFPHSHPRSASLHWTPFSPKAMSLVLSCSVLFGFRFSWAELLWLLPIAL